MISTLSRRDFLKIGGAAAGALILGQFIPPQVAEAARASGMLDATNSGYIASMCEMCVWRCGLLAKVEEGRVVKLEGNPDHPHSKGKLCPRGQSGLMNTYDPDRVLTPLIRVGKRGEGLFRKASWNEALDLVASKMLDIKQKYGPEAMIFSSTHNLSQMQFENLLNAYGSPNYGTQRSLCFNAMIVSNLMTYGMEEPGRQYDSLKYILLTGRNLVEAISTSETSALSKAIDRGASVAMGRVGRFVRLARPATRSRHRIESCRHRAAVRIIYSLCRQTRRQNGCVAWYRANAVHLPVRSCRHSSPQCGLMWPWLPPDHA